MAKTPLSEMERVGRKVSKVLTDIATKLDSIKASDSIQPFQVPEFDKIDEKFAQQFAKIEQMKKAWKTYGENYEKVTRRIMEVEKIKEKADKQKIALKKEIADLNKRGLNQSAEEKKTIDDLTAARKKANEESRKTRKWMKQHADDLSKRKALQHALRTDGVAFVDKTATKALGLSLSIVGTGFEYLESALKSNYDMVNRFRGAMGAMAETIGVSDSRLEGLQRTAMETYLAEGNGLGALGMGLPDITQNFGALATSMQYTDTIMAGDYVTATKLHKAFGLTTEEMGNLLRGSKFMNIGMGQLQEEMRMVGGAAVKLGMNSRMLTKDVFVLGKNLLDMAGPKWRGQMQDAIVQIRKMGISVQAMEKFTDMTDVFDTTVESMAKLNTAFGLHIDALKMFDEQDPAKRMQMVSDQLRIQGKTYETMTRQQKKFLAQTMGLNMEETNALLQGKDMVAAMEKQDKITESLDNMMQGLRTTLFNVAQIMDRIGVAISRALIPMFDKFKIKLDVGVGKAAGFFDLVEAGTKKVVEFIDKLGNDPAFIQGITDIADAIIKAFKYLADPKNWGEIRTAISDVVTGMADVAHAITFLMKPISWVAGIFGKIGKYVADFAAIWAAIKIPTWVSKLFGIFGSGEAAGAAGGAAKAGMGALGKGALGAVGGIGGIGIDMATSAITGERMNWGRSLSSAAGGIVGGALGGIAGIPSGPGAIAAGMAGGAMGSVTGGWLYDYFAGSPQDQQLASGQPLQARASGGDVQAGVPYLVGEMGREKFTPGTNGTITPNNKLDQPIIVQVILDGEVIQDKMYKANLRSG